MSELIQAGHTTAPLRHSLLMTASVLGIFVHLALSTDALAATTDEDTPTVWIELGGQLERVDGGPESFSPAFFAQASPSDLTVMSEAQRSPRYAIGGEGKITFAPKGSDWLFSAGVKYGRSNKDRHLHHQTLYQPQHTTAYIAGILVQPLNFSKQIFGDDQSNSGASHFVLDFQAGKDVGLGLFGSGAKSVVSAGVRYAQFSSSTDSTLHARPVLAYDFVTVPGKYRWFNYAHHTYTAVLHAQRNTHAVGPSVSWDASVPIAGRESEMTLTFDWGANAAVLFGRQRARVSHATTGYSMTATGGLQRILYSIPPHIQRYRHSTTHNRSRSVTIPNVGGFAGLSFRYADAKISLGYRADFFFGAVDNGIDNRHATDEKFYGPFGTISMGLGD